MGLGRYWESGESENALTLQFVLSFMMRFDCVLLVLLIVFPPSFGEIMSARATFLRDVWCHAYVC